MILLTRRGKTKFATIKIYNLCLQIIQSQTCYPLNISNSISIITKWTINTTNSVIIDNFTNSFSNINNSFKNITISMKKSWTNKWH